MSSKNNGHLRSKLYERTLQLLRDRPRAQTLAIVSQDTGLPFGWLASILKHPHLSPSVDRIERLYEYLSGNKLEV